MTKLIVIVGPTASGKTDLSIKLANEFNGEIINADAFQVYREMSIGTAKATSEECAQAVFHLNGTQSIYDEWNIKIFIEKANEIIKSMTNRKKIPIIVGGSHLYIDALINNYDLSAKKRNNEFEELKTEEIYKMLMKKDKNTAEKIGIGNRRRLVRALQIFNQNKNLTSTNEKKYDPIYLMNNYSREQIYERINKRTDIMFKNGWIEEVESLYKNDKNVDKLQAFRALGYKQILDSIIQNTIVDIEKIKQISRNYAKRQLTWVRNHYHNCLLIDKNNINEVFEKIKKWINNK